MADLSDLQSALTIKLTGAGTSGIETNFVDATANGLKVDGSAVTQPISAASLPLPTGAATETTLASIDSKITAYSQVSSGTLTALNQAVTLSTIGLSSVTIQTTGTFVATYTIEATVDGTNYVSVNCSTQGGNSSAFSTSRGDIVFPCGGYTAVRTRISAFTSGSVVVTMRGSISSANAIKIYQDNTTTLFTQSNTRDGNGNILTSQANGTQRALDVGINVAGVQIDPRSVTLQTGTNTIGSINNISGTISLPTGAATETTLSSLNAKVNNLGAAVNTADILNVSGLEGTLSVTTTATPIRVGAGNLTNRKLITFFHSSSNPVYWGYTSGVTTTTGTPITKDQMMQWPVGPNVNIYLISTATVTGRITEGA